MLYAKIICVVFPFVESTSVKRQKLVAAAILKFDENEKQANYEKIWLKEIHDGVNNPRYIFGYICFVFTAYRCHFPCSEINFLLVLQMLASAVMALMFRSRRKRNLYYQ